MRVTTSMLVARALYDLDGLREQYAKAQDAVNGRALTRPSDDPQKVVEAMDLSGAKERLEAAKRSGDDARAWLAASEDNLSSIISHLQDANQIVVQAGSPGLLDQDAREAMAQALDGLRQDIMRELNATYNSQYLFAGWQTDLPPFTEDPVTHVLTYTGTSNQIQRDIAPGLTIAINVPGDQLIAASDMVKALYDTATALRSGNTGYVISTGLQQIQNAINSLSDIRSSLGVRQKQVEDYQNLADAGINNIEERLANLTGADLETAVLKMTEAQNAYQAALASFAKSLPMSLLDYMMR